MDQERERRSAVQEGSLLHKYLHHGLSSQAMIFNLLGPLSLLHEPRGDRHSAAAAILRQVPYPPAMPGACITGVFGGGGG